MKKFLVSSLFCLMGGVFLQGDTVPSVPAQLLPLPPTADVPLVPAVTEQAALPAAAPTVVAASLPSVAVSVTPEPAPLAAAPPMPGMAPINASAIIPSTSAHASASAEADKSSLFVEPSSNGPDSTQRKDMFEKTADDEHKAQDALASIEQSKNERLDAYLAFDAELDALYEEAGVVRGDASTELALAKQVLLEHIQVANASDKQPEMVISEETKLVSDLNESLRQLREIEAVVVAAVKALSDNVIEVGDMVVQVGSWRFEMNSVLEQAVAADLLNKIKEMSAKVVAAQVAFVAPAGKAIAVDDALKKGREQIAAVKKILADVAQKKVQLHSSVASAATQGGVQSPVASTPEAPTENVVKKKRALTTLEKVHATLEYCIGVMGLFLSALWQWLHDVWHSFQTNKEEALVRQEEGKLDDPVLERIRLERHQSVQRIEGLAAQRELIAMKDALLDRLEAERMMQLDTKEKVHAELTRAYDRHERELSWLDLGKRFAWKMYAALRRLGNRLMSVRFTAKGVGEEKTEI